MGVAVLAWFFVLGTVIGSFLNVVIYRFNTGMSLAGRSRCLSCGTRLSWRELVPIISYLMQRGRCRSCRARVASQYLAVEMLTGVLFALIAHLFLFDTLLLLLNLGIAALLVVTVVYYLRHTIIHDGFVRCLFALSIA